MHVRHRNILASAVVGFLFAVAPGSDILADQAVSTTADNVAIAGYDTVAYFVDGRPVKGDPRFEHVWQGARWHFASAGNRDTFAGDPVAYAPRYGGFCSGGMTLGVKAAGDPEAWAIVDGKLYLASSKGAIERFTADPATNVATADETWQRIGAAE